MFEVNLRPTNRELRQFGLIALIGFGVLGTMIHWKKGLIGISFGEAANWISYALWALGGLSALWSLILPAGNRPLYLTLTVVTYPLGFLVSLLLMALFFYGVLTSVGVFFRLIGRDPLNRKLEPQSPTYWVRHISPDSLKRYFQQF